MPIYEYRCPQGHTFEVFQRMTDPPVGACDVCGEGGVEKFLYPVAVHFKGSGFYTTDYGRGNRKRDGASDDGTGESKPEEKKQQDAPAKGGESEKKRAEAG